MAGLTINLLKAGLNDAVQWAWQFVGCKQLAANQRVHYDDLDIDPDKHNLQAERISIE